jgi:hypothetical protein
MGPLSGFLIKRLKAVVQSSTPPARPHATVTTAACFQVGVVRMATSAVASPTAAAAIRKLSRIQYLVALFFVAADIDPALQHAGQDQNWEDLCGDREELRIRAHTTPFGQGKQMGWPRVGHPIHFI